MDLDSLYFEIDGPPVPKGRPRVVGRGRNRHAYTPKRTIDWENAVRQTAVCAAKGRRFGNKVPLSVHIHFGKSRTSVRVEQSNGSTMRGDLDNYVKAILDGLQHGVLENDRQVVEIHATTRTAEQAPSRRGRIA